ncbi:MAG: hypothetical protein K940chlam7_01754 [Chlamydiae bacterium]|nr:hypothetical protein [Chlamydiota bacterium]
MMNDCRKSDIPVVPEKSSNKPDNVGKGSYKIGAPEIYPNCCAIGVSRRGWRFQIGIGGLTPIIRVQFHRENPCLMKGPLARANL